MIEASDIMSEHIAVIYDDMLIRHLAHLLLRDRVSVFPVVNKKVGIVGIVTMTDLFRIIDNTLKETLEKDEFFSQIDNFKDLSVSDIMSKEVISIQAETSLTDIIHMVVHKGIHSFPVMEGEKIIGIVSRHDILNAVFAID